MEKGDISGRPSMRLVFVFEGLIAHHKPSIGERLAPFSLKARVRRWEYDTVMIQQLWDVFWRLDHRFDVVTFLGEDFAGELEARMEDDNLPFSNVLYSEDAPTFARAIALFPDIEAVFHGSNIPPMTFGGKDRIITDVRSPLF